MYALYVWSGLIATLVLTRFWLLIGGHFTVTKAKRLYPVIGAGSVLGAIVGSLAAGVLTSFVPAGALLPAAAFAFAVGAALSSGLDPAHDVQARAVAGPEVLVPSAQVTSNPYVRRLAVLTIAGALVVTVVDYVFKASVVQQVPRRMLAPFFGWSYFALNVLSLVAQLTLVRPVVRLMNVSGAAALMPLSMGAGALLAVIAPGFASAMLLKALDGGLRHSVHRTATELLFVPMSERLRSAAKPLLDAVAQRGGQALGSVLILLALAFGAGKTSFAVALIVLSAGWIAVTLALRQSYVELFRITLRETARSPRLALPELDMGSLESLLVALNSRNDAEVRAALRMLEQSGRARLIPALILYHPSPAVVSDALDILMHSARDDFQPIVEHLLEHAAPAIRAAALRAQLSRAGEQPLALRFVDDGAEVVRATALSFAIAQGHARAGDYETFHGLLQTGSTAACVAALEAIRRRPSAAFEDVVIELSARPEPEIVTAALRAMAAAPSARYLPALMRLLPRREHRAAARGTLVSMGDTALSYLEGALSDEARPAAQRRHIPRTIVRFDAQRAARALLERLPDEKDGIVRYKILRALEQLRQSHEKLRLDHAVLDRARDATITLAYRLLHWETTLAEAAVRDPRLHTDAQQLLIQLLHDKHVHALERLFLILSIRHPEEDFAAVMRGLRSTNPSVRASSRELVEYVLEQPLRRAVIGLMDDHPGAARVPEAGPYYTSRSVTYAELLAALLQSGSESAESLTAYHVRELELASVNVTPPLPRALLERPPQSNRGLAVLKPVPGL
jgi:AAA family ATP:ADP antiporter